MRAERLAGGFLAALLAVPAWTAVGSSTPEFDQGFDMRTILESIRRTVRKDGSSIPASRAVAEEGFGFSTGNDFTATMLYGEISVSCHDSGRSDHSYVRCSSEVLDPAEFVRFIGPKDVAADQVALSATWESGQVREKTKGWDSAAGRSTERFNLWIATLFQRPLLDYGKNAIRYFLKKGGQIVREGSFTANVRRGERRVCRRRRHYTSSNLSDCRPPSTNLCDRYFRDENYCQ